MRNLVLLCLLVVSSAIADEDVLTVAVASNFVSTAEAISERFADDYGVPVRIVSGSTGKLYAQIVNGAPYDVFLAADSERPRRLEAAGLTLDKRRITYAFGRLVLFTADKRFEKRDCKAAFLEGDFDRLAIANPDTAPYGRAAREFLENVGLWEAFSSRVVQGENVAQAAHFVLTGNATFGIGQSDGTGAVCTRYLDRNAYSPIRQQAVVLARTAHPDAATYFVGFLQQSVSRSIIADDGYLTVDK